jgi:hypothetical protein
MRINSLLGIATFPLQRLLACPSRTSGWLRSGTADDGRLAVAPHGHEAAKLPIGASTLKKINLTNRIDRLASKEHASSICPTCLFALFGLEGATRAAISDPPIGRGGRHVPVPRRCPGTGRNSDGRRVPAGAQPRVDARPDAPEDAEQLAVFADFNGDNLRDLAIGAPTENFGSTVDAGAVSVFYGVAAGSGLPIVSQTLVQGNPEADDQFGAALDV